MDAGTGTGAARFFGGLFGESGSRSLHGRSWRFTRDLYMPVFVTSTLLVLFGLIVVWSASLSIADASLPRQALGAALGLVGAIFFWHYDYRTFANYSNVLLGIVVVLMILPKIPGFGYEAKGITGWVKLPVIGLRFQPSEPAKIVTILLMASLAAQYNGSIDSLKDYVRLCGMLALPFLLILLQPDLGTGLVIVVSGATIIACGGARRKWLVVTVVAVVGLAALVIWVSMTEGLPNILKPYQLKRLLVFVDPSLDPAGDGYNLQQSMIAVGSGGFLGKGIGNASQAGQGFLPEAHTDFVFALLSEEFGFVGSMLVVGCFCVLIIATLRLAQRLDAPFGKLVLVGIAAMWAFQAFENIGMNIGIMPITGIPLPFVSFGSSSMITQLVAVGLVQSVYRYRPKAS